MRLLGKERQRRGDHHVRDRRELVGRRLRGLEEARDHLRRRRQDQHAADDLRHSAQAQPKPGGDAEVALAAADRPEQVRLRVLARLDDLAVGGHHLGREQVVDRQPGLPSQEPDPTRQGDPADADRAGVAESGRAPLLGGGERVLARRRAGLDPGGSAVGVDLHPVHPGEVDDETAVDGPVSGAAVAAAADGELEAAVARRVDHRCDVLGPGDPRDRERPLVDPLEDDLSSLVVRGIVGGDQLAGELRSKIVDRDVPGRF